MHSSTHIPHSHHRHDRRLVGFTHDLGDPCVSLRNIIKARHVGERTVLPQRRDRTHNQPWIESLQRLIIKSQACHHTWTIVFYHHIHMRYQCPHEVPAGLHLQVDTQTLFPQIVLHEVRTATFAEHRVEPRRVTLGRLFNLDDLSTHLGHQLGSSRTRNDLRKVQDPITCKQVSSSHAAPFLVVPQQLPE